ncbi:NAC domain-containing protein [Artemisia annua]|uniref:NAC domain-containing protein n=1 Tax=Artemisia annua TaxID=35608 RepID=A0A2U1LQN2_ARTAN|nr:NAC domain-containing protein [Artemisia annua]
MHHQGSSYQVSASTHVFQQEVHSTYQDNQSVELNEDDIGFTKEVLELLNDDYADSLKPGYCFCPTDSEIIVYYLQPKIETGEQHPKCWYYTDDFYGDTLDNLAANHRHCENKWYFLTPRDRKYPNGTRPNRRIKNFGFWKASTKDIEICDDVTGEIVGRRSLAYYDEYSQIGIYLDVSTLFMMTFCQKLRSAWLVLSLLAIVLKQREGEDEPESHRGDLKKLKVVSWYWTRAGCKQTSVENCFPGIRSVWRLNIRFWSVGENSRIVMGFWVEVIHDLPEEPKVKLIPLTEKLLTASTDTGKS